MTRSKRFHEALSRLAAAEDRFRCEEFLAPVVRGGGVRVRIAGVICQFALRPRDFEGWGVFRASSAAEARLVRPARLPERQRYLELFPVVRLVLCEQEGRMWSGLPAHQADGRFRLRGLVPIHLVEEARMFEVIEARFDGGRCWFDRADPRRDPGGAAYLRQALVELRPPQELDRLGLTAEERAAYEAAYRPRLRAEEEVRQDRTEGRLRSALNHAGARLHGYLERDDGYQVEYTVDGRRHVSVVAKGDLTVQAAGICLSGEDARFDLPSLVGVLRESYGDV